jgi:predicted nucleotidyltransferase
MKVAGIITEYNPFHNGHKYHIEEARRVAGADYIIAVMSGNFVQRGTPAIIDKYSRTQMALNNGVDIVLELPVCYATGSAEYFAMGAVALLNRLGIVDSLCFGSECGDISLMEDTAGLLLKAPKVFDETLLSYVKEGYTYPAARAKAAEEIFHMSGDQDAFAKVSGLLSEPNNILGLEYVKALNKLSSSITPITIQRQSAHYHDTDLGDPKPEIKPLYQFFPVHENDPEPADAVISSATAIRSTLQSTESIFELTVIRNSVPEDVYEKLTSEYCITYPISEEDFSQIIKYKLLAENNQSLTEYVDITADLADRMSNIRDTYLSITELSKQLKTRNVTHTRINRALTHLLLNIKDAFLQEYTRNGYVFYARVLGIRRSATHLLKKITTLGSIPVITKVTKANSQLEPLGKQMLSEDIFATHLYNQTVYEKFNTPLLNEYKHGIIIL